MKQNRVINSCGEPEIVCNNNRLIKEAFPVTLRKNLRPKAISFAAKTNLSLTGVHRLKVSGCFSGGKLVD